MRRERLPECLVFLEPCASIRQIAHFTRSTRNAQMIAMALCVHQPDLAVLAVVHIPLDISVQGMWQRPILRPDPHARLYQTQQFGTVPASHL